MISDPIASRIVLAARAAPLRRVLRRQKRTGRGFVILDGTLGSTGRRPAILFGQTPSSRHEAVGHHRPQRCSVVDTRCPAGGARHSRGTDPAARATPAGIGHDRSGRQRLLRTRLPGRRRAVERTPQTRTQEGIQPASRPRTRSRLTRLRATGKSGASCVNSPAIPIAPPTSPHSSTQDETSSITVVHDQLDLVLGVGDMWPTVHGVAFPAVAD